MKPVDVRKFFESLSEHDLIVFLAVLQEQKRSQLEPLIDDIRKDKIEYFILYMHLFFDSGTRYLSVELSLWWNRGDGKFDSNVKSITEYENEHALSLMHDCEKILYEGIREHS